MIKIGIYKITNPQGEIYIGCTVDWERRQYEYLNLKVKGRSKIKDSLIKFGTINHKFELIEECNKEELYEKEIFYIQKYNCVETGLNIRMGGRHGYLTEDTKQNISKALKGRRNTWIKKGQGLGRHYNEKSKEKISKGLKEYYKLNPSIKKKKILNEEIVKEIRTQYKTGNYTRSYLSRLYNVSWGTIKNITDCINSYK